MHLSSRAASILCPSGRVPPTHPRAHLERPVASSPSDRTWLACALPNVSPESSPGVGLSTTASSSTHHQCAWREAAAWSHGRRCHGRSSMVGGARWWAVSHGWAVSQRGCVSHHAWWARVAWLGACHMVGTCHMVGGSRETDSASSTSSKAESVCDMCACRKDSSLAERLSPSFLRATRISDACTATSSKEILPSLTSRSTSANRRRRAAGCLLANMRITSGVLKAPEIAERSARRVASSSDCSVMLPWEDLSRLAWNSCSCASVSALVASYSSSVSSSRSPSRSSNCEMSRSSWSSMFLRSAKSIADSSARGASSPAGGALDAAAAAWERCRSTGGGVGAGAAGAL
mmetsp:Transcript_44299/g.130612  ORF Transcript_44299/g.130612 Transcript_44299/m.130612 type:complete len:347 (-) Transcript_44299:82-1122(-)